MLLLNKTKLCVQYKINYTKGHVISIYWDERDEIRNDIGDRKEEKADGLSVGPRRSHEALREPIKFVPAVEVGPNEI